MAARRIFSHIASYDLRPASYEAVHAACAHARPKIILFLRATKVFVRITYEKTFDNDFPKLYNVIVR